MAIRSLGKVVVTTGGTPVRITLNESAPTARVGAQSIYVQTLTGNTGKIYIGSSGLVKATGVGVFAVLPIPTTNILPGFSMEVPLAPAGLNCADIYIDADVNGEAAIVSYMDQ